jgi:hypothetical protein
MLVEMSDTERAEFASWLRERAQNYLKRAEQLDGSRNGNMGVPKVAVSVTQEQFEQSVLERSGRVYDVARRLKVDENVILGFLKSPSSKVIVGDRGWLKPKEKEPMKPAFGHNG